MTLENLIGKSLEEITPDASAIKRLLAQYFRCKDYRPQQ